MSQPRDREPACEAGVEPRLRFMARSLDPASWGGEAPLPELDVEGALAKVLGRADALPLPAPAPRRIFGWTRALAATLLFGGGLAFGLFAPETAEGRATEQLAGVTTAAVVYAEHSGSGGQKG